MADDTSTTALLERLVALQEEQLALTRQSLARHADIVEREKKLQDVWERLLATHDQQQALYEQREARHQRIAVFRTVATLALWLIVVVALVILLLR